MCRVMSPSSDAKLYSRAYNTDAAFPLWVAQALHSSGTLIKGGESGTQIRRITTVCGQMQEIAFYAVPSTTLLLFYQSTKAHQLHSNEIRSCQLFSYSRFCSFTSNNTKWFNSYLWVNICSIYIKSNEDKRMAYMLYEVLFL